MHGTRLVETRLRWVEDTRQFTALFRSPLGGPVAKATVPCAPGSQRCFREARSERVRTEIESPYDVRVVLFEFNDEPGSRYEFWLPRR
jgi:hypothetical protein